MAKTLSTHAQAAAAIRKELKSIFPYTTFKVTSESFSGGNSVRIRWTDGPTTREVDAITGKYQYGHFDGMYDIYESSNRDDSIPQAKFVHGQREISREAFIEVVEELNKVFGYSMEVEEKYNGIKPGTDTFLFNSAGYASQMVWRTFMATSLICKTCKHPRMPKDIFCGECGCSLPPINEYA